MTSQLASLAVLAGLVAAACGEARQPIEPITADPSLSVMGSTTQCVGSLPSPGPYANVEVPPGQTCHINAAVIRGNVKALEDSRLSLNNSIIGGNVEGDKADELNMFNDDVKGNVTIKGGVTGQPANCGASVEQSDVAEGNIQIEKTATQCIIVSNNTLGKGNIKIEDNHVTDLLSVSNNVAPVNIQVFKNTGTGAKVVMNNAATGVLQCLDNLLPFVAANPATPRREGQCL